MLAPPPAQLLNDAVTSSTQQVDASSLKATKPVIPPDEAALLAYILEGPLLQSCGITKEEVHEELVTWKRMGDRLAAQLGFNSLMLNPTQRSRVYHYYLPVFFWVVCQLRSHRQYRQDACDPLTPLVVGISAPQGCGKSTIVEQLQLLFNWLGHNTAAVSIDDFYLSYKGQTAVANAHPGNKLLQFRGNAGTHDLQLSVSTLEGLKKLTAAGSSVAVPRYNKSAYAGRGDQTAASTWPVVEGPLQLVLFEGWMLGFSPLAGGDAAAVAVHPDLVEVDRQLREYQEAWDRHVDCWLVVRVGEPQWVFNWRQQAEERMIASGKPGMTREQLRDFVGRFMPAYEAYLPHLYTHGPTTARPGHLLVVQVDEGRIPVMPQPSAIM